MRMTKTAVAILLLAGPWALSAVAQEPAAPASSPAAPSPDPWPKTAHSGGATYTMYQPQLDSWDQYDLSAHAAVSVLPAGAKDPVFGVVEITSKTHVSRSTRTVEFHKLKVESVKFPTVPDAELLYAKKLQEILSSGPATMPLDRLEAELAILNAHKQSAAVPVKNEPPAFVFTQSPAVLVSIGGQPAWTQVSGTPFTRVLNTRALILKDASGNLYVHLLDGFLMASALSGPWAIASPPPAGAGEAAQSLAKKNVVDLM